MDLLLGFFIGVIGSYYSFRFFNYLKIKATKDAHNKVYKSVLNNFNNKLVAFDYRINNVVEMSTSLPFEGDILIMYFFDKKEVSIFRGRDCLYSSTYCDPKILEDIVRAIWTSFANQINTGLSINGNFLDSGTVYKTNNGTTNGNVSSAKPKKTFKIDDILDKINIVGYENLSNEEKEFLKNIK